MASLDLQQFLSLAQTSPEFIWKGMERFVSRGEEDKLYRLVDALPAAWWTQDPAPARSPAAVAQASFWARTIKRGMMEAADVILSRYPAPAVERRRVAFAGFAAIADARNDAATRFFFPADEAIAFSSKHWEVAFKSKNNGLFDRINPQLDARRALNFIENFFFDLQLNQIKRLGAFVQDTQWPLSFARDAIARFRGPGMISFFIDKGFKASRINAAEVRGCLLASVRADNGRALQQILAQISATNTKMDWAAPMELGDVMLRANEDFRINAVKIPENLRKSPLVEAAILRGDAEIAQALIDAGAPLPQRDRMNLWFEYAQKELKSTGVKATDVKLALAQAEGCYDLLSMIHAAAAHPTHSGMAPETPAPQSLGSAALPKAAPNLAPAPASSAEQEGDSASASKPPRMRM